MILERRDDGGFDVELFDWQRDMLTSLSGQLRDLLLAGTSPALQRLFPTAYPNDADANDAYNELVGDQLLEQRLVALDTIDDNLDATQLSEEALTGWMQAMNSMRLVLGTRLDVSEEDDPSAVGEDHPDHALWVAYDYLSYMLGLVVDALAAD